MKLSIITATLNSSLTLEKTLGSLKHQNIQPHLHVFVDGGSCDTTLDILNTYMSNNPTLNIEIIHQLDDSGIYGAWNMGLSFLSEKISEEDVVFMLNSDDWLESYALDKAFNFFSNTIDIVAGAANIHIDNQEVFVRTCRSTSLFPFLMPIIDPSSFVRMRVYKNYKYYNQGFKVAGDYDFHFRCFKAGLKYKIINAVFVNIKMGGFADQNKKIAMYEAYRISKSHGYRWFATLSLLFRFFRIPRFNWFDKL